MLIKRSYKTELNPNQTQIKFFYNCAGASRFIFNFYLETKKLLYKFGKQRCSAYSFDKELNKIKLADYSWLYNVPASCIQIAEQNVDLAYKNMFDRMRKGEKPGFPKFKGKYAPKVFSFTNIKVDNNKIRIPKIGWVRLKEKGYIPSNKKTLRATISERCGRWFVSVLVEEEIEEVKNQKDIIGIDIGIKTLAVTSKGKFYQNNKELYKEEKKLKRFQRMFSRRKKGSNNQKRMKQKISKLHYKIANKRNNNIHELTSNIIKHNPEMIVLEDLKVKNMLKNKNLSKAISDSSFFEIRRQLEYKSIWNGTEVLIADKFFPSTQICSQCGNRLEGKEKINLSIRTYKCKSCGAIIDRDYNASLNLKKYGEDHRNLRIGRLEITE